MFNKLIYAMAVKNKNTILAIACVTALSACEKVVNVDLKNVEPRIVIEGTVDNSGGAARVRITKSVTFGNTAAAPTVSGATVKISDDAGNNYTLLETTAGLYTNATLLGQIGKTYTLTVQNAGVTYTGKSTIPRQMPIDTVYQEAVTIPGNVPGAAASIGKIVTLVYTDLPGFGDNVQVLQTINGKLDNTLQVADDQFTDGSDLPYQLYPNPNTKIKTGDVVKIEMRFVDKNVFKYLSGIQEIQGGNTVPANPDSNLSGGCLGYFSAHTSESQTLIIQ
jgi:Domain of unknown function (DUF4249)